MDSSLFLPTDSNLSINFAGDSVRDQDTESRQDKRSRSSASDDRANVSSACTACREKHLKCDGGQPCSRCKNYGCYCQYVRSRRGYKGPRRGISHAEGSSLALFASTAAVPRIPLDTTPLSDSSLKFVGSSSGNDSFVTNDQTQLPVYWQRCLEGFFHFFHQSHPFLPPKEHTISLLRRKPVPHLQNAMCYIASQYVCTSLTANLSLELETLLSDPEIEIDGFLVQALLLFVIGLDGNNEQSKAVEVLARAQRVALQLGMHRQDFAMANGGGCPVLEESWRRTWWELYVVDGLIAGLHQISAFHLFGLTANVPLPCEEHFFKSGHIPTPLTIDEFDNLLFSNQDLEWSSYTCRIVATRNLGRILQHKDVFLSEAVLSRLDNHLANWRLHLPNSKQEYFDATGQVDELLFQAHMITDVSSILLHRQYSQLHAFASQSIISCAPHPQEAPGWQLRRFHSAKTIQSATNITKLVTLPTPLLKHTHFLICAMALASVVHLASWSTSDLTNEDDDLKGQVRICIGGLKAIGEVWPSARRVLDQVSGVAQEVFFNRKSALNTLVWNSLEGRDMTASFVDEEIGSVDF